MKTNFKDQREFMRIDEFNAFIFALFFLSASGADTLDNCWNTDRQYGLYPWLTEVIDKKTFN